MTDINSAALAKRRSGARDQAAAVPSPSEERLIDYVELLFFAYRDFTGEADAVLEELGFGRAHHRVLHFVNRTPGLRVIDLLDILKITKQSLARVLRALIEQGYIEQRLGEMDRRERLLYATERGRALAARLAGLQIARVKKALAEAGHGGDAAVERFLTAMIAPEDQPRVAAMIEADRRKPRTP